MNLAFFDGQYKSKPVVSLRGASKHGDSSRLLILKAQQSREERELSRKRTQSAIKIQSVVRGHITRKRINDQFRTEFDSLINVDFDEVNLIYLTNQLILFYHQQQDESRLILLCQKWISCKHTITTPTNPNFSTIGRLLTLCLLSLRLHPQQPLANCLRLIDIWTTTSSTTTTATGTTGTTGTGTTDPCGIVIKYLLSKGYYKTLRSLIESRFPSCDQEDVPINHPLMISLLDYIERPLIVVPDLAHQWLLWELLAPPMSPHVCYAIIPWLSSKPHLLSSLIPKALHVSHSQSSVTLCYSMLKLIGERTMISLSNDVLCSLLELVSLALQHNISERQELTIDQEEEEEDDVAMDLDPLGGDRALIHCIIDTINSQLFIKRLNNIQGYPSPLLKSLCSVIYHMLMISSRPYLHFPLIRSLSFSSPLLRHAWSTITSLSLSRLFGPSVNCLDQLCRGSSLPSHMGVILLELLSSFSPLLSVSLSSLHDSEVASHGPFSLTELAHISLKLKDVFIALHLETHLSTKALYSKTTPIDDERPHPSEWKQLSNLLCHVLRQLYERNVHLQFLSSEGWSSLSLLKVPPELFYEQEDDDGDNASPPVIVSRTVMKHAELLKKAPFVFPFIERVNFFQRLIAHSRTATQGHFQDFVIGPSIDLTIRRSHLYEDAFSKLSRADIRNKLRVTLVNAQGLDEAGIDGGGVFREFLSETIKTGYDPDRGFFVVSPDGGLYPNPHVHTISDSYHLHYQFLGALLGKVLFEHMLVELPFASFFIRKLTIGGRGWVDTHHLSSLDPELYHHLLSLKEYTGDLEDLELDFTASVNEYGQTKVIELKAGGGSQIVNHSNLIQYIHLLAHYHLNVQINQQFKSFRYGLSSVIPLQWLTLFNEHELQTLISGARVSIDVEDLRKNTQYSGTYDEDHPTIQLFWEVVQQFSEERKQELLKFVTSCSRPPLLGFSQLHPPFTILSSRDPNYLPSASTCMHLLKLPMFNDKQTMRDKLIYSISSGAGFELS